MQREPRFQETVNYIRDLISRLEKQGKRRRVAYLGCARGLAVSHSEWSTLSAKLPRTSSAMHFGKYLKTAFLNHWNLLAFLGGCGVRAAERPARRRCCRSCWPARSPTSASWASHPKFQQLRRCPGGQGRRERDLAGQPADAASTSSAALPRDLLQRFQSLRTQCLELRQIALELKRPGMRGADMPLGRVPAGRAGPPAVDPPAAALHASTRWRSSCRRPREDQIQKDIDRLEKQTPATARRRRATRPPADARRPAGQPARPAAAAWPT